MDLFFIGLSPNSLRSVNKLWKRFHDEVGIFVVMRGLLLFCVIAIS
ncbi:hypothetical protein VCHENC03_2048 [Vibrio sp. HENC-03]|nr:hypothetical protein VCHENC03_2048 [Vibrio sp. HENC-03]